MGADEKSSFGVHQVNTAEFRSVFFYCVMKCKRVSESAIKLKVDAISLNEVGKLGACDSSSHCRFLLSLTFKMENSAILFVL